MCGGVGIGGMCCDREVFVWTCGGGRGVYGVGKVCVVWEVCVCGMGGVCV